MERYKSLLLKQRDIMIALTQRLNERDEQILGLQAELEAYDSHQRCVWGVGVGCCCCCACVSVRGKMESRKVQERLAAGWAGL